MIGLVDLYKTREFDEDICWLKDFNADGLVGTDAVVAALRSDKENGITDEDLVERKKEFGSNHRDDLRAQTCCEFLNQAMDDTMIKLLIVCAVVSAVAEMALAYSTNRCEMATAWMDGAFIAVAVGLVTGIGASVDYKKEVAFVDKRNNTENGKRIVIVRNGKP